MLAAACPLHVIVIAGLALAPILELRTCLSPEFKDRGCLGDLNGQIIAFTEGEKIQEAKEMIKEKTAMYASTISSNTKVLANKAQQSPPVT